MSGPPEGKGSEQSLWRNLTLVLVLAALAGLFLLRPSRAHPDLPRNLEISCRSPSSSRGGVALSLSKGDRGGVEATPTPIPWDDIQVSEEGGSCTDEALAVAGQNVYVVYQQDGIYSSHSTDGGYSFPPSVQIHSDGHHPHLVRQEGAGPEEKDLFVVFREDRQILFTRSPDAGDTWMVPVVVYDGTPIDTWPSSRGIAVDAGGGIYIVFHQLINESENYFYVTCSSDGGATWSEPLPIHPDPYSSTFASCLAIQGGTLHFAWVGRLTTPGSPREVLFTRSTDGGETWSEPVRVDDGDSPGERVALAMDQAGVIYAAWSDTRLFGGGHALTYVARSTDGGANWSPGVRVDDAGDCVRSSTTGAIAVDEETNSLHVALTDGRNYCKEPYYFGWTDIYYTYSTDGGLTWSPNEQISDPILYRYAEYASIQTWMGVVYTTFKGSVWLDIHDPGLPPVTPTPTPSPSVTPTPSDTPTPTATPSPTNTPTPAPTGSPTSTPVIEPTETATPSPGFTETATPSPSPTATPPPSPTLSPTVSATPTMSPTAAVTPTPFPTPEEWRVYLPWIETWVELGD